MADEQTAEEIAAQAHADAVARGDVIAEPEAPEPEAAKPEEQAELDLEAAAPAEEEAAAPVEEEAPAEEPETDDKGHMIPKARFDQAVGKERAKQEQMQAELNKYRQREQQLSDAQNFEEANAKVKELLKTHASLMADGELDKAADTMEEILQRREDMQNVRMARQAENAGNSAKIAIEYDQTVSALEAEYPEINPDSEDFDEAAVRQVQVMVSGLMQSEGKNPAAALKEATDILLKPKKEAAAATLREKPDEEVAEAGLRRKQEQIAKNVEAAAKQPPATDEIGQDHDKTGGALNADMLASMSYDDFVKIPDAELAKLRGDFIQ